MLVLSRKSTQSIVFPDCNISIKVVTARNGSVKLGIDAPSDIRVFREEVLDADKRRKEFADPIRELRHKVNNRLNSVTVGLEVLRAQVQTGRHDAMPGILDRVRKELHSLAQELEVHDKPIQPAANPPQRMLLVEDDENERELLAGLLRIAGFKVDTAGDGADAMDYLQSRQPDAVLLDMVMPRTDGWSIVQSIRRKKCFDSTKLFVVSGHWPSDLGIPDQPKEINRWFHKPINPNQLLSELQTELA